MTMTKVYFNETRSVLIRTLHGIPNIALLPGMGLKDDYTLDKSGLTEYTIQTLQEKEKEMSDIVTRTTAVIDTLIANDELFTLLDVSNAVKADGGPFVRHEDVKVVAEPVLNLLVKVGKYDVKTITVTLPNNTQSRARLFLPWGADERDYDNRNQAAAKPVNKVTVGPSAAVQATVAPTPSVAAPVVAAPVPAQHVANAHYSKVVKVRADGAIEIPKKVLEAAGLDGAQNVCIVNHPNSISIVSIMIANAPVNVRVTYEGVRIGSRTLAKSGLKGASTLSVSAFTDKIVISR